MKNQRNTSGLTPWKSDRDETLAANPICVKLPVKIDTVLREKENRSIWIRRALEFHLLMEDSCQRTEADPLTVIEEKVQSKLQYNAEIIKAVLGTFYEEVSFFQESV